jgi:hypothetical protein
VSAPEQKPESNAERAATPVQSPGRYAIIFGRDGEDGIRSAG